MQDCVTGLAAVTGIIMSMKRRDRLAQLHGLRAQRQVLQAILRKNTYVEIGNFYQRIVPAQISGTDQGMYGEYWNNLRRLKEWNDEAPDRDLVTLRLYREIVTKTLEYAGYLQEDGVPPQEMEDLLNEISQQTENMKTGAGQVLMEEIQELEQVLKGAQQMLASCKWKGGAS